MLILRSVVYWPNTVWVLNAALLPNTIHHPTSSIKLCRFLSCFKGMETENKVDEDKLFETDSQSQTNTDANPEAEILARMATDIKISSKETYEADYHSESEDEYPNLLIVDLPEVALVQIMEYLNLKDRYHLSLTCHLFHDLFTHPQLWQIAHIDLYATGVTGTKNYSRWKLKQVMTSTMTEIVIRFSHLFQHLTLNMDGYIQRFDDVSGALLEELRHKCRLESLTLKLGPLTSDNDYVRSIMSIRSDPQDVPIVVGLINSASRLKRLKILSWPLFVEMEDYNILLAICANEKLKSLDSLSLFFIDVKKDQWTERIPKLPSVQQTLDVISFLPNLTHLALRSPMIDGETISLLASPSRAHLRLFQILITFAYYSRDHNGIPIPDIAAESWQKLTRITPHLQVEFVCLTRIPWEKLMVMLKPEVPLSSMSLLTYSQCSNILIDCIATHYGSTLKTFKSLCDSSDCDEALKKLVTECPGLRSLLYHGDINYKTVIEIVDLTKHVVDKWDLFQFKQKNIKTDNLEEEDEDVVVKYDAADQKYYLGAIHAWHTDNDKADKKIDEMAGHVRKYVGTTSNPFLV